MAKPHAIIKDGASLLSIEAFTFCDSVISTNGFATTAEIPNLSWVNRSKLLIEEGKGYTLMDGYKIPPVKYLKTVKVKFDSKKTGHEQLINTIKSKKLQKISHT